MDETKASELAPPFGRSQSKGQLSDTVQKSEAIDDGQEAMSLGDSPQNMDMQLPDDRVISYLQGWRLHTLTVALCLSLFLSTMETTIVSTSLVAITNALKGFQKSSWVVTSYLLTYTGFLIILSKLSDIFGRKPLIILTVLLFTIFSAACGAAQNLTELIVLRAFQGIGGGGIYTLVFVISFQMVPTERYAALSGILSAGYALSTVLGPILGGLINDHTTWRWVFLLNVPAGVIALAMLFISMPASFPYQPRETDKIQRSLHIRAVQRLDFTGALLLLAASILLVTALEEGGTEYSWKSAVVLTILCVSIALWILFFCWERYVNSHQGLQEPVLPWRLVQNRFTMGFLLNAFFGGAVFIAVVINIPQKFQVVNDLSAFGAGWRLLALMLCTPLGSGASGFLIQRLKIPPFYIFIVAAILQTVGLGLMGSLSATDAGVAHAQYGYQVILGLGIGLSLSSVIIAAPTVIEDKDTAVFMGALAQFRILGGSLGLAVCTNILNNKIKTKSSLLTPQQLNDLLRSAQSIKALPPSLRETVRQTYAAGYNEEMQVLIAFAGAAILSTLLMWEKKPRKMP